MQQKILRRLLALLFSHWTGASLARQRAWQERMGRLARLPRGVRYRQAQADGVPAVWLEPHQPGDGILFYLHGGGYVLGSTQSHCGLLGAIVAAVQWRCLSMDYRLAPEHPFPAALDDALAAYRWLRAQTPPSTPLVIAGDSAGGGLAMAMMIRLREVGEPLPTGAVLLSPWVDLTLSGASIVHKAKHDPILSPDFLAQCARAYAGPLPLDHPLLSPLNADLRALPPLLIHVGSEEILLDDARRLAARCQAAGVEVRLHVWEGMFHVFPMFSFLPEARQALAEIATFLQAVSQQAESS